jgi:tetratricopeptide (TPR) repeat protein
LAQNPASARIASRLANALAAAGNFGEATSFFQQAVNLDPYDARNHALLAQVLTVQKRYDEAVAALKNAIAFMSRTGNGAAAAELQKYLDSIPFVVTP